MGLLRGTLRRDLLRHARTDTTPLTPTPVPPTATMDLAGFPVDCSSASGHGAGADAAITGAGVTPVAATTVAEALPDVDTTEAARPTPGAEAFAVAPVMDMRAALVHMAGLVPTAVGTPTAEVLEASVAVMPTVEAGAATVDAEMLTAVADIALVAVVMPSAAVGTAEADMVVVTGRFHR
jgi:hypothetical protein